MQISFLKRIKTFFGCLIVCASINAYSQCASSPAPFSPQLIQSTPLFGGGWVSISPSCMPNILGERGIPSSEVWSSTNFGSSVGSGPLSGGFTAYTVGMRPVTTSSGLSWERTSYPWGGSLVVTSDSVYLVKDLVVGSGNPFIGVPLSVTYSSIIEFSEIQNTLNTNLAAKNISQSVSGIALNGAHSQPLSRRVGVGQKGFWVSGDWGTDNHGTRSGSSGLADFGFGYNYGSHQINLSIGETWARQAPDSAIYRSAGNYLLIETIIPLEGGVWLSLGAYGHQGEFNSTRTYESSSGVTSSLGTSNSRTLGWRGHLDFENLVSINKIYFSPYIDLTKTIGKLDAYAEVGGDYPAIFDERKDEALELRLGVNGKFLVSENLRLLSVLEGVRRVSENRSNVSGQFTGVGSFDYSSNSLRRKWLRFGVGLESKVADGTGSINLNFTTKGEALNSWIAAQWVKSF